MVRALYREASILILPQEQQAVAAALFFAGEGCALHPSYVSYVLNQTNSDTVATYVANALACAGVIDKGRHLLADA